MRSTVGLLCLGVLGVVTSWLSCSPARKSFQMHPPASASPKAVLIRLAEIDDELKSGRMTLHRAADRVTALIAGSADLSPLLESGKGFDLKHKAAHMILDRFLDDETTLSRLRPQYERLTGCRYFYGGFEKID